MRRLILWSISTGLLMTYVLPYSLWILSQLWNFWAQDSQSLIPIQCKPLSIFQNIFLAHNAFSQVAGFLPAGYSIFFITGGGKSFHLFALTEWYETRALQVYVNAMFAQYVLFITVTLLLSMLIPFFLKAEYSSAIPCHGRGINTAQ